jgi:hypothetical protein
MWRPALLTMLVLAGCARGTPSPECAPERLAQDAALPCDEAVRAAVAALPDGALEITRVQVVVGSATPWGCGRQLAGPGTDDALFTCEHVVFTYADGARQYVQLWLWNGTLRVASPAPY